MEQLNLIKTGIQAIDCIIGGMYPSELFVIGAMPGGGKTTFLCDIAANVCKENEALFFSLQTNKALLKEKFLNSFSDSGMNNGEELFNNLKIEIIDNTSVTIKNVISITQKSSSKKNIKFVFIDGLNLIFPKNYNQPSYMYYSVTIRKLKQLAKELNIIIVVTNSLSRAAEFEKPEIKHLRGGGGIEDVCDVILLLQETKLGIRKLIVAKNNRGIKDEAIIYKDGYLFAKKALNTVIANPYKYNPIFIYGKAGSGKTSLIKEFMNNYINSNPSNKIRCWTGFEFLEEFYNSLKTMSFLDFRNSISKLDCLIIDGIDAFQNNQSIQDFLQTIIENLDVLKNKQLIFSSNFPPRTEGFSDDFISNITRGVFIRIDK